MPYGKIRAVDTEVVVFTGSEYAADVQEFQEAVNSWLKSQPDNAIIEDIIYKYSGVNSRGKDLFSMAIVSRLAPDAE
ncbi:hypothetical protein ACFLUL_03075 [Chloroflexota bacterium]